MTNSPPNPPPERREPSDRPLTVRWLTRPSTLIFGGITTVVAIAGVVGVQRFASERIPPPSGVGINENTQATCQNWQN